MDNSIHFKSKFSSWTSQFGFHFFGDSKMRTISTTNSSTNTRHTSKFAALVTFLKKLDDQPRSSTPSERLERSRYQRTTVDSGPMIRNR
jgi:hypothetical protein